MYCVTRSKIERNHWAEIWLLCSALSDSHWGHYEGIINTNIAIMSLLHPLMSPLASNPPSRIICLRPFVIYENASDRNRHKTLSSLSRFKFSVMMTGPGLGTWQEGSGTSRPLIGPQESDLASHWPRQASSSPQFLRTWHDAVMAWALQTKSYKQSSIISSSSFCTDSVMSTMSDVMMSVTPGSGSAGPRVG